MEKQVMGGFDVYRCKALVLGSGCAGLNAADSLHALGVRDVAIVTEGLDKGTSRNTGSDKQTYYKLSLAGKEHDSVFTMAWTLFEGGSVHGDLALCEAAGSVQAFMKLCALGVPFPTNEFGEYVGYKTDHDPARRATSAGPLTSKYMVEALEKSVKQRGIQVLEGMHAIELLVEDGRVRGLIAIDESKLDGENHGLTAILCEHLVLCTGGPAGIYKRSVYPVSQHGALGLALRAGARAENLSLWQYGLASTTFRWNVSGSYQQVIPRYVSVDEQGTEHDFLTDALGKEAPLLTFLKGYQWPFDVEKLEGSSRVDALVHEQSRLGRRVYMDFMQNPKGFSLEALEKEASDYLLNCGATGETPYERLLQMNPQAAKLYRDNGIDLSKQRLEIAVCAQHHNGGIAVDVHWQTNIKGLYAAGEAAGTFGSSRPGGSALNSTQVGSWRAAQHIALNKDVAGGGGFDPLERLLQYKGFAAGTLQNKNSFAEAYAEMTGAMSDCAAHIREEEAMEALFHGLQEKAASYFGRYGCENAAQLPEYFNARDQMHAAAAVLQAALFDGETFGSRVGALYKRNGQLLGKIRSGRPFVITTRYVGEEMRVGIAPARFLPEADDWFERVWKQYRETHGIN